MKKNIALCLAIILSVSIFTGCQKKETAVSSDGAETYSYWVSLPSASATHIKSMNEITMYKKLEALTGVKINFIHPSAGQASEKFNLMIASREFPDIIESDWTSYPGGPEKAVNDNVIIKLNDMMDKYTPNFKKQLNENAEYDKQSKTDGGFYFGFPSLNVGKYRTFGGIIIRQDWLDELGLSRPETIDEWTKTLRAFKEKKGAAAPFTATSTMFSIYGKAFTFNNAYNVGLGLYIDEGKIKFAPVENGYREFLALMNKWYEEGLLDNEYASNNAVAIDAKMTNGESGACFGYIGGVIGRYMSAMEGKDPKYNLTATQYPVLNHGDEPRFIEMQREANAPHAAISTSCKNPEGAAKWLDFLYTDEGNLLKNFGEEGVSYNIEGNNIIYTDEIMKNPNGLSVSEALALHTRVTNPAPGFNQDERYLNQYYTLPQQREAMDIWTKYFLNSKKTMVPPIIPLPEESAELTSIYSEVSTYTSEMILKFVQGSESIDKYDSFVSQLKNMKVERLIELQQKALDRYNQR